VDDHQLAIFQPKVTSQKENGTVRASRNTLMVQSPNRERNMMTELTGVWVLLSIVDMIDDLLDSLNGTIPI
jgi:hypothetical protein